jgi:hypothetical protein
MGMPVLFEFQDTTFNHVDRVDPVVLPFLLGPAPEHSPAAQKELREAFGLHDNQAVFDLLDAGCLHRMSAIESLHAFVNVLIHFLERE